MKRTISLLSVLAFVLAFSGSAFSQAASTDVTASAEIVSSISFSTPTGGGDLNFGQLSTDLTGVSINPTSGGTATFNNTGTGAQQGEVTIETGSSSQSLSVEIDSPANLENGGDTIGFTADHIGNDGTTFPDASAQNISTSSSGEYTIYLGGALADGTGYATGNYTGTITVNVDYQ